MLLLAIMPKKEVNKDLIIDAERLTSHIKI